MGFIFQLANARMRRNGGLRIYFMENLANDHHKHEKDCCHSKQVAKNQFFSKVLGVFKAYQPLIVILCFCILLSLIQLHSFEHREFMHYFMGYFFVFLSLLKFFDLKGFVEGFSTYDFITQHVRAYGYLYPFIELSLGVAYLTHFNIPITALITLIVMLVAGAGVLTSMLKGQKVKCACLGTTLNVELGAISVLENFGMGAMAAYELLYMV